DEDMVLVRSAIAAEAGACPSSSAIAARVAPAPTRRATGPTHPSAVARSTPMETTTPSAEDRILGSSAASGVPAGARSALAREMQPDRAGTMSHPMDLLLSLPAWGILLILVALLLLADELGFRLGRRHATDSQDRCSRVAVFVAALLALLGLLLAFSFSIVEARFSARKALVIDEANAIGTTYLRAKLLPAPHGERIQRTLRRSE